jgi:hypothetical protein
MQRRLTVKRLDKLRAPGRYRDQEVRGLYLEVRGPSTRSYVLRYQLNGKERWMGLGSTDTFSLEQARQRARDARRMLSDKVDPMEAGGSGNGRASIPHSSGPSSGVSVTTSSNASLRHGVARKDVQQSTISP